MGESRLEGEGSRSAGPDRSRRARRMTRDRAGKKNAHGRAAVAKKANSDFFCDCLPCRHPQHGTVAFFFAAGRVAPRSTPRRSGVTASRRDGVLVEPREGRRVARGFVVGFEGDERGERDGVLRRRASRRRRRLTDVPRSHPDSMARLGTRGAPCARPTLLRARRDVPHPHARVHLSARPREPRARPAGERRRREREVAAEVVPRPVRDRFQRHRIRLDRRGGRERRLRRGREHGVVETRAPLARLRGLRGTLDGRRRVRARGDGRPLGRRTPERGASRRSSAPTPRGGPTRPPFGRSSAGLGRRAWTRRGERRSKGHASGGEGGRGGSSGDGEGRAASPRRGRPRRRKTRGRRVGRRGERRRERGRRERGRGRRGRR